MKRAYERQIPGIVISRAAIYKYGEERRTDRTNPNVYPPEPTKEQEGSYTEKKAGKPPKDAPNQWEPGKNAEWFTTIAPPRNDDEDEQSE